MLLILISMKDSLKVNLVSGIFQVLTWFGFGPKKLISVLVSPTRTFSLIHIIYPQIINCLCSGYSYLAYMLLKFI